MVTQRNIDWVLLSYRIPREPSTPRIAVWRRLKQLGIAQLGDGLVALPANARSREHLEWVAEQVLEADGEATVWIAKPTSRNDTDRLKQQLVEARDLEYRELLAEVGAAETPVDPRTRDRWRRQWRSIDRRDYFRSDLRVETQVAIDEAVNATATDDAATTKASR